MPSERKREIWVGVSRTHGDVHGGLGVVIKSAVSFRTLLFLMHVLSARGHDYRVSQSSERKHYRYLPMKGDDGVGPVCYLCNMNFAGQEPQRIQNSNGGHPMVQLSIVCGNGGGVLC